MHFLLYVCLPTDEAVNSFRARQRVSKYLNKERFVRDARFSGYCDYFSIGGHYSGTLNLLRLKNREPKKFKRFMVEFRKISEKKEAYQLFRHSFPKYDWMIPLFRDIEKYYGYPDDAQVMDKTLFKELKRGFSEYVSYRVDSDKPNVIFTNLSEDEWPATAASAVGQHWVVVIDYHE
jgi:hypothetical protein